MSIQRCEYEITTTRGEIQGEICTLTGRGCFIVDLLKIDTCARRMWAKQYQAKHSNPQQVLAKHSALDGPRSSTGTQGGMN